MISILIPIYNGIEFIDDSVSSVLSQTYDNWELLLGVNGHPENSDVFQKAKEYEKKVIKYTRLIFIKLKENRIL
jgi:glycosyltransferase involved in cell wall biosynthesis